jgi:hypothetical protein
VPTNKGVYMYNISLNKVGSYDFIGIINALELTDDQLAELGLIRETNDDLEQLIEVIGDFSIEWDDDIPMPQIDMVTLVGANTDKTYNGPLGLKLDRTCEVSGLPIYKQAYGPKPIYKTLDLDLKLVNLDDLEQAISNSGQDSNWQEDLIADLADRAQSAYEDR